jgi:signal transduction histidine kinase
VKSRDRGATPFSRSSWYRRRAAAFLLVICAAGATLVLFASRQADGERAAWQQERRGQTEKAAGLAAGRVVSTLSELLVRLSRGDERADRARASLDDRDAALVSDLFVIQSDETVTFPVFHPPYRLGGREPVMGSSALASEDNALRAADQLEFAQKDIRGAIQANQAALKAPQTASLRARTMNGLARALAKAGRRAEALAAYQDMVREFDNERSDDGIPFGLIGRFAAATVADLAGDQRGAAGKLLDLRERLMVGSYDIAKVQFMGFLDLAEARFAEIMPRVAPGEVRRSLETRHATLSADGKKTLDRAERAELIALNPRAYQTDDLAFSILPIKSGRYLVGSTKTASGATFGIIFDVVLIGDRLIPEIACSLPLEDGVRLGLSAEGLSGPLEVPLSDAPLRLSCERALGPQFSPWTVRAWFDPTVGRFPRFGQRKAIYVAAALILIGAILSGGLIAIRGMAREMELVRLKTDFVATISHELRTPLTSIRYISELLRAGRVAGEVNRGRYYETLFREGERLHRMIENILDFSRIEAGLRSYRLERIEPGPFTSEIAGRFVEIAAAKGFVLNVEVSPSLPSLDADPEALERALFNLLDNALKYSGESKDIDFRVLAEKDRVRWEVIDRGIGICDEDKARIFERFFRSSPDKDPSVKGSGIGLTIAKHIVEAHGGSLSVESEIGRGSTVIVTIPAVGTAGLGPRPEKGSG